MLRSTPSPTERTVSSFSGYAGSPDPQQRIMTFAFQERIAHPSVSKSSGTTLPHSGRSWPPIVSVVSQAHLPSKRQPLWHGSYLTPQLMSIHGSPSRFCTCSHLMKMVHPVLLLLSLTPV